MSKQLWHCKVPAHIHHFPFTRDPVPGSEFHIDGMVAVRLSATMDRLHETHVTRSAGHGIMRGDGPLPLLGAAGFAVLDVHWDNADGWNTPKMREQGKGENQAECHPNCDLGCIA